MMNYSTYAYSATLAIRYSLFKRAMCEILIPFGHSSSHAPVLVQPPKPSSSILATMLRARRLASTFPCGNFDNYLFTIASNLFKKQLRRKKFKGTYNEKEALLLEDLNLSSEMQVEMAMVLQRMDQLPKLQREALILFHISDLPLEETRIIQGGSLSAVKQRIKRGRERLVQLCTERQQILITLFFKPMKNENKIDNYFDRVKQNPPLMDIEKVHRLIIEAEVKAEVKVKKRHSKFLKFTIMTTIFAVIISAVILWPIAQEETPNYKNQNSNAIENTSGSMPLMKQEGNGALTTNNNSDNEIISKTDLDKGTTEATENSLMLASNVQVTPKSIVAEPFIEAMPIVFDTDTFEPVDGSKFVLKLSKEELEKIGFQVEDSLILYENNRNEIGYRFGKSRKRVYGELTNYTGYYISCTEVSFEKTEKIQTTKNEFSFYPVYKSSRFYSNVMSNGTLETEFFESANDTLLPIIFPDFEDGDHDILLWFVVNNQLYNLLSANHKPILNEFQKT